MAKEYVQIYFNWRKVTQDLTSDEKANLIDAVVAYAAGEAYEHYLFGGCKIAFRFMQDQVDRDAAISEARARAAGKKKKKTHSVIADKPEQTNADVCKPEQNKTNASKPKQNKTNTGKPEQNEANVSHPEQNAIAENPAATEANICKPEQNNSNLSHPEQNVIAENPAATESNICNPVQTGPDAFRPKKNDINFSKPEQTETKFSSNENEKQKEEKKEKEKDKEKEKYKEKENESETKKRRFSRPTPEEVADYCRERRNHVDPQRFCDFYEAKGWKIGRQPMVDWRAAIRTWEQRTYPIVFSSPRLPAQQYSQRVYAPRSPTDLYADIARRYGSLSSRL